MKENKCRLCEELEPGDTLYQSSSWDGGIGFDYINDIQYCPVCGAKLITWDERRKLNREARKNEAERDN